MTNSGQPNEKDFQKGGGSHATDQVFNQLILTNKSTKGGKRYVIRKIYQAANPKLAIRRDQKERNSFIKQHGCGTIQPQGEAIRHSPL